MPRNPPVYNTETAKHEANPRSLSQIESKEYFAVLDLSCGYMWLSHTQKKHMIDKYFQNVFEDRGFILKDMYKEDDFINILSQIDQIKISVVPTLFSESTSLSKALTDEMYGANTATLHLKYAKDCFSNSTKEKITQLFSNRESFRNIMIAGRDKKNLGVLFNHNLFTRKIDIKAQVDENEMFVPHDVFSKVITKIREKTNASR